MPASEHITVLFTDLVDSTEMASALSPEAADELRRAHFSVLRQAVAASGGTEVKNLGDGLMVVFPAASAALSCAVAMQQAVERDNRRGHGPLGLRVGISAGEATKEAEDYFGEPVIEAARLCAKAERACILASDSVRVAAGRRSTHSFRRLGELEFKGLPYPVEVLEITWEPLSQSELLTERVPLPSRLSITPTTGVVGRELEINALVQAFKRVATGEGREVFLISGEPGMGKSTLAAQAARQAFDGGATVLLGRSTEEIGSPYGPFVEALRHLVLHTPEKLLSAHVAQHGAELATIVPALRDRLRTLPTPQSVDLETERYVLYGAVVGLLAQVASSALVVLVLEDLQWADKPSLQLLRHLISNDLSMRVLVICTYRDTELSATQPLIETLGALRRESGVTRLELKGLDDSGVIALMESAAGHELDSRGVGLAHALYRETDGNPFFVSEVLRSLAETGAIHQDDTGRWSAARDMEEVALPESVREVIGARVARLGESARQVLSFASVIGRDFDLELLARVAGQSEDELLDILDAASSVALVEEVSDHPGRFAFSHALVQHTLYQDLGATRRTRAHRSVAEALEAMCGDDPGERVAELAHHFINATQPVDTAKAMTYSCQAGDRALASLAPDDAVRHFSQALRLCTQVRDFDPLQHTDLLLKLGTAQRQAGVPAFRTTLLDAANRARELGTSDRLVAAALANNRGFFSALGTIDFEKVEVLGAALSAVPDDDNADRALLLATLCNELTFGPRERRLALAEDAKRIARRLADDTTLLHVLNTVNQTALLVPSLLETRARDSLEAVDLATQIGDAVQQFWASDIAHMSSLSAGDFDRHREHFAVMKSLSQRLRQPMLAWVVMFHEAAEELLLGNPQKAEELADRALKIGTQSGQPDAFAFYGVQLLSVRLMQGRAGEIASLVAQLASENPDMTAYQSALCAVQTDEGECADARRLLEAAATDGFSSINDDAAWMDAITNYAKAAIELEAVTPAGYLFDLLKPLGGQVPFSGLLPKEPVDMYLGGLNGVLGRYDAAETHFNLADELNRRGKMRYAEAQTDLLWGRMLLGRGESRDIDRARDLLQQARSSGASRGYALIERRTTAELSKLG
jgi:class 3 adenylate cyclase/tetratricopeptide (TPR) repeat protein